MHVKANPGSLTNINLSTSPSMVGGISNATFSFMTSSNSLNAVFGIYVKVPTGIQIQSTAKCLTDMP